MIKFSHQEKTISIQLAVAFAQVTFGIASATLFTLPLNSFKLIVILINIVLTILFSGTCFILVNKKFLA